MKEILYDLTPLPVLVTLPDPIIYGSRVILEETLMTD